MVAQATRLILRCLFRHMVVSESATTRGNAPPAGWQATIVFELCNDQKLVPAAAVFIFPAEAGQTVLLNHFALNL